MTKALLKKQMLEVFAWIYKDRKTGKNRSKNGIIGYIILYIFIFGLLGSIFYNVASLLCDPLNQAGLGWLFFAIMGLISVALGVFGSVFNTFSSLYLAKDNDLLLSTPVPPSAILVSRLAGVYVMGLMYELIVMIPTLIVYFIFSSPNAAGMIFSILIPLILSVAVLTLSCILGCVVAKISTKIKHKNIITVVLSLIFLAIYYYVYAKAYSMLQVILQNPEVTGSKVKSILYPFYHMGLASQGNVLSMLIFTAITAAVFGIVYIVLSRSFLKLATASNGAPKAKYKEKALKANSVGKALVGKEMRRFLGSSTYMLNCGLGVIFLIIASVLIVIKNRLIYETVYGMFGEYEDFIPLMAAALICMITSMNDISAPSVSLEGKSIWLLQSLPVSPWQALRAKIRLHLILTLIPTLILGVCVSIALRVSFPAAVLILITAALFVLFTDLVGLSLNLKMPNLKWTNETVPIKQSMSVMITLFGGWAVVLALGAIYFALFNYVSATVYFIIVCVLFAGLCTALYMWIKNKGSKIFASL